jgi:hypothetical protein
MDRRKRSRIVVLGLMGALAATTVGVAAWPKATGDRDDCAAARADRQDADRTVARGGFGGCARASGGG